MSELENTTEVVESQVNQQTPKKNQRKGKQFATMDKMLEIAGLINNSQETVIKRKLDKQAKRDALINEKEKVKEDRKNQKKQKLDQIKEKLKAKSKKKKVIKPEAKPKELKSKKQVRFT